MDRWGSSYQNWECTSYNATVLISVPGHCWTFDTAIGNEGHLSESLNSSQHLGYLHIYFVAWVCSGWPLSMDICISLPKSSLWIYKGCSICRWQAERTSELISLGPQAMTDESQCIHKRPLSSGEITLLCLFLSLAQGNLLWSLLTHSRLDNAPSLTASPPFVLPPLSPTSVLEFSKQFALESLSQSLLLGDSEP